MNMMILRKQSNLNKVEFIHLKPKFCLKNQYDRGVAN